MEKKQKITIFTLIAVIVILLGVIIAILFTKEGTFLNKLINPQPMVSCENYSGNEKCVVFKEGNIEIVKNMKVDYPYEYYLNNHLISGIETIEEVKVIEKDYVLLDVGVLDSDYRLYDKNGKNIDFPDFKDIGITKAVYNNKKLVITGSTYDDNIEDICTYKPLDTIVFLEQEVEFNNGSFGKPKTIKSETLKQYAKNRLNVDCQLTTKSTKIALKNNCALDLGSSYLDYNEYDISGIKLNNKNYTLKYIDYDKRYFYLNNKLFETKENSETVLSKVCNYDNHLIITMGWEGYPINEIYDANANKVVTFTGNYTYDNNLLNITEHSYIEGNKYYTLNKYSINLKNNNYRKNNIKSENHECDEAGYYC